MKIKQNIVSFSWTQEKKQLFTPLTLIMYWNQSVVRLWEYEIIQKD